MGDFKTLRVWQDAVELAVKVYALTNDGKFSRDFGLKDQIQRAAVSISSKIAEGDERKTTKESIYYLNISKGSSAEVITQLFIAFRVGYVEKDKFEELMNQTERIRASLKNLIRARTEKLNRKS